VSGDRPRDEIDRRMAEWDARTEARVDAEHAAHCIILDDRCCARAWAALRAADPATVGLMELLYGKDWWAEISGPQRLALALMVASRGDAAEPGDLEEVKTRLASGVNDAIRNRLKTLRGR
jgi:hypothetical protein